MALYRTVQSCLQIHAKGIKPVCNMAFKCPPEYLLRNAIRTNAASSSSVSLYSTSSNNTMKAAVCTEIGKPLVVKDVPKTSELPEGCVRIGVHSAAVNFGDILVTQGKYQEKVDPPFIPGNEVAGEILELGQGVKDFNVGDRIFGTILGMSGAFAEEVVMASVGINKLPQSVPFDVAASFKVAYGTAYMALTRQGRIQEGETVLVTAAAGAVGLAAVDLAANVFKCKVIGAVGDESKIEVVKSRGASDCVVYSKEKLRDRVKELTDGKGADIIFDAVGGKIMEECLRCIAFEGRLLVIGFASGDIPKIPANLLLVKSCSAVGVYWGSYSFRNPPAFKESVDKSVQYLVEGKINPLVGATFPLNKANDAFQHIMARKNVGKVIINPRQ